MLTEIYCDKFRDNGDTRPPIKFHNGLNVILGSASATNSIGKTTFLLAIDFAFGGKTYVRTGGPTEKNIGAHTICFTFEFSEAKYRFARHTSAPDEVYVCDDNYHELEKWTIAGFTSWLQRQYGMDALGSSFRDLIGGFFRIYGKDDYDETRPLRSFSQESDEKGIRRLIRLFGKYGSIEQLQSAYETAKDKKRTFAKAKEYAFVKPASSATEVNNNKHEIDELRLQLEDLARQSEQGLADIDPVVANHAANIKRDISSLRLARGRLTTQLATMRDDLGIEPYEGTSEYTKLQEFFPNIEIRRLEEIEAFHKRLTRVLRDEHEEAKRDLGDRITKLDSQIHELEDELTNVDATSSVSIAILQSYADLSSRIRLLEDANACYEQLRSLSDTVKIRDEALGAKVESTLRSLETLINNDLELTNADVCGPNKTPPQIAIPDSKHYTFGISEDNGTGSQTRGMFLLDYALLKHSYLPAFAHDTNTIKQVQDDFMVKLLELYDTSDKQVFVAIDKAESFAEGTLPEVVAKNAVIRLGLGHELFGWSWAEK